MQYELGSHRLRLTPRIQIIVEEEVVAMTVTVDTSRVEGMLADLAAKTLEQVMDRAARQCLESVSGIPVDTGRLASSLQVRRTRDGAQVYTDVEYARYVFGGTKYVEPQPPEVGYTAADLADDVAKELFQ